ncbi:MAG: hypothetical protein ACAH95_15315, partial [Fimbriimonas sp.]
MTHNWVVITSKPITLPKEACGVRGFTDVLNEKLNRGFGKIVVRGKNDSELYSWERGNLLVTISQVQFGSRYYSFLECGILPKDHRSLPAMPDDPKSTPMSGVVLLAGGKQVNLDKRPGVGNPKSSAEAAAMLDSIERQIDWALDLRLAMQLAPKGSPGRASAKAELTGLLAIFRGEYDSRTMTHLRSLLSGGGAASYEIQKTERLSREMRALAAGGQVTRETAFKPDLSGYPDTNVFPHIPNNHTLYELAYALQDLGYDLGRYFASRYGGRPLMLDELSEVLVSAALDEREQRTLDAQLAALPSHDREKLRLQHLI